MNNSFARPFLKWAGGKTQLLNQYTPYFPSNWDTYYEPFLGGGAVFFYLVQLYPERRYVLSDINAGLINAYICVRDCVTELINLLKKHQANHSYSYYYTLRAAKLTNPIEQAARFIYLNKTCFNGLYRENARGEFNVPIGRYRNPCICDEENLQAVSYALQKVELHVQPFEWVLNQAKAGDFIYFDPPYYPVSSTSKFTDYTSTGFSKTDQVRLRDIAIYLSNRGAQILISNSDCEFIRDLYRGFTIYTITAKRSINSRAERRGTVGELLITNQFITRI